MWILFLTHHFRKFITASTQQQIRFPCFSASLQSTQTSLDFTHYHRSCGAANSILFLTRKIPYLDKTEFEHGARGMNIWNGLGEIGKQKTMGERTRYSYLQIIKRHQCTVSIQNLSKRHRNTRTNCRRKFTSKDREAATSFGVPWEKNVRNMPWISTHDVTRGNTRAQNSRKKNTHRFPTVLVFLLILKGKTFPHPYHSTEIAGDPCVVFLEKREKPP